MAYSTGGGEQGNNTMFIQDETGGLWIEFDDAADNTCDLNQVVTLHMYGQHIERDAYTNGLKIAGLFVDGRTESAVAGTPVGRTGRD